MTTSEPLGGSGADGETFRSRARLGAVVALALAVLTVIEYVIAVGIEEPLLWLLPLVVAKGALIMEYFMHFSSLFSGGDH